MKKEDLEFEIESLIEYLMAEEDTDDRTVVFDSVATNYVNWYFDNIVTKKDLIHVFDYIDYEYDMKQIDTCKKEYQKSKKTN